MIYLWATLAITGSIIAMIGVGKLIDLLGREAPPAPDEKTCCDIHEFPHR